MVSNPSLKATATTASCWSAASVARSTQVEGPPSVAAASVAAHAPAPSAAPPSRLVEPSGTVVPTGDPQQAACAVQNALASSDASPRGVPGPEAGASVPEVHATKPAKSSARKVA